MIVRVGKRSVGYTVIDNATLTDASLTWEARGLLAYLLSKPDDWTVSRDHLATQAPNGIAMVRRVLTELEEHGYLVRSRVNTGGGRFAWEAVVYERPTTIGANPTDGVSCGDARNDTATIGVFTTGGESTVSSTSVSTEVTSTKRLAPSTTTRRTPPPPIGHTAPVPATQSSRSERPRNELFDAVAEVCGMPTVGLTKSEAGRIAAGVKQLREVNATPDEIRVRAGRYRATWPKVSLTPQSLASHWSDFAAAGPMVESGAPAPWWMS